MRSLVAVCGAHHLTMEERRRAEMAAARRRARYERYRNKCSHKIKTCDADLAVSVLYDGSRLDVRVQNPLTHIPTDSSRFTTYEIAITTNNIAFTLPKSYVRRRYSEFAWLREWLATEHSDVVPPSLPPKTWWGGQFEPPVIEQRLWGLRTFMQGVLLERVYLSNKALHLFVQTQLYTREIEDVLSGRDRRTVANHIELARKTCSSTARCICCREEDEEEDSDELKSCMAHGDQPDSTAAGVRYRDSSASDCENGSSPPVMSSTPRQTWSDSGLADDSLFTTSSESDDSDKESQSGEVRVGRHQVARAQLRLRPVLSQSLPNGGAPSIPCSHRKRRVTFSTEVTVAKVVENNEEEWDEEDEEKEEEEEVVAAGGSAVTLVEVHKNKAKMKAQ